MVKRKQGLLSDVFYLYHMSLFNYNSVPRLSLLINSFIVVSSFSILGIQAFKQWLLCSNILKEVYLGTVAEYLNSNPAQNRFCCHYDTFVLMNFEYFLF